ncbi:Alpha-actinin-like protein 1 [Schizosaccharomyces pombe 972h-] [Rhizoctonia solani]|uniref:Alpha-actinin-like protein 1 [Schizosaccharomyces pombe 972h-] n=1 Tax=Rhizoctonia solani TaxID=456999 RepID=A0A0K6FRA3_9AGAM|nr:Alpha-actinin-like protein 1 [Schizosaccharomyces pombe 972h-] [Rhizoctonia solani]
MTSLVRDLSDGVKLIQIMEIMGESGDVSLGRYNKTPRMRVQKAENVNKALEFITSRGVKLTNIGPEDCRYHRRKRKAYSWDDMDPHSEVYDCRYQASTLSSSSLNESNWTNSEEGLSAKEGLLLWCQRKTAGYKEVDVQDFGHSWSDGLALCALIHHHRPDLIDYASLDKTDKYTNTKLAFDVAEQHLGIPQLLDVEDLCDANPPDERSVMTYIASFFHAFSSMDQQETVSRRVEKFADLMYSVWLSRNDYEKRMRALLAEWSEKTAALASNVFDGTYTDAKQQLIEFQAYKNASKRQWVSEKQDLAMLFTNVQTKLRTYGLREYIPPEGLELSDMDAAWSALLAAEATRSKSINAQIREIKESLRKKFANVANNFERRLRDLSNELSNLDGPLEDQLTSAKIIQTRLGPFAESLKDVASTEQECLAANVEENDYTIFTHQDLGFELELVVQSVVKKIAFIDNQIVARNMSNLTPAQLEQFESTFRYFDRDETNTLELAEMTSALASLGIVYSEEDLITIHEQLTEDYGAVTFEAFINLLVDITEDQTSPAQLRDAFRGLAGDKPFVTEVDLRAALLPPTAVEYLQQAMPRRPGSETEFDYEAWLDDVFA